MPERLILSMIFEIFKAEPPEKIHPVVWFGRLIEFLYSKTNGFFAGLLSTLTVIFFALLLSLIPKNLPSVFGLIFGSYLLYSTISIRSMIEHAEACIEGDELKAEKVQMIVSRDTSKLSKEQLSSAVIESVAENFVDGVISPLFYYIIFGLPGALLYKAVNVCDAMVGYRYGKFEKFGKFPARLDDLLNFIPSRISVLFFSIFSIDAIFWGYKKNPKLNGNSISAMASVLKVKLEKPGSYRIDCGKMPDIEDVKKAITIFKKLSIMAVVIAISLRILLRIMNFHIFYLL